MVSNSWELCMISMSRFDFAELFGIVTFKGNVATVTSANETFKQDCKDYYEKKGFSVKFG